MRSVNCSLQWSVSLLNIRDVVRSIAISRANSTSMNVKTPLASEASTSFIDARQKADRP